MEDGIRAICPATSTVHVLVVWSSDVAVGVEIAWE
jgi:hypothetical protein